VTASRGARPPAAYCRRGVAISPALHLVRVRDQRRLAFRSGALHVTAVWLLSLARLPLPCGACFASSALFSSASFAKRIPFKRAVFASTARAAFSEWTCWASRERSSCFLNLASARAFVGCVGHHECIPLPSWGAGDHEKRKAMKANNEANNTTAVASHHFARVSWRGVSLP
jgi:hypothetical protein